MTDAPSGEHADPNADLVDQLAALGEAAELQIEPVRFSPDVAITVLDPAAGSDEAAAGRVRSPMIAVLSTAALLIAIVAGGALLSRSNREADSLPLATLTETLAGPSGPFASDASSDGSDSDEDPGSNAGANDAWAELRECESSRNYSIDSGNTFYGAYQFTWETWQTVGGTGNPADAPPYEQDVRAAVLHARRGAQPWPICGHFVEDRPMVMPLVPGWVAPNLGAEAVVFLAPDASAADTEQVRETLAELVDEGASRVSFIDKQSTFDEFQQLFADDPRIRDSVTIEDMPPSFRVDAPDIASPRLAEAFDELRALPAVFDVIQGHGGPTRQVRVPRLGIDRSVPVTWTGDDLLSEVAIVSTTGWSEDPAVLPLPVDGPLIVVSARRDWDLSLLEPGDVVTVETAVAPGVVLSVEARVREPAATVVISSATDLVPDPLGGGRLGDILLVAPDPDDPLRRIVVPAQPVPPRPG